MLWHPIDVTINPSLIRVRVVELIRRNYPEIGEKQASDMAVDRMNKMDLTSKGLENTLTHYLTQQAYQSINTELESTKERE